MHNYQVLVAGGSLLLSLACAGGDEWGQAPHTEPAPEPELGHSEQAVIDDDDCFDAVPPFVQAGDFFTLSITGVARPTSTCQGAEARFIMIDNFVKDLGIPAARPNEAAAEDCADLEISFAVGLYGDPGDDARVIARGTKRGQVVVREDGVLFCDVTVSLKPDDLDDMPDGRDYIFVVQALEDGRQNDFSEDVILFNGL